MSRAVFDGMSWPIPNHEIGWKMRYGNPTKEELLQAASEMDAYAALISRSQKRRNYICAQIVKAMSKQDRAASSSPAVAKEKP